MCVLVPCFMAYFNQMQNEQWTEINTISYLRIPEQLWFRRHDASVFCCPSFSYILQFPFRFALIISEHFRLLFMSLWMNLYCFRPWYCSFHAKCMTLNSTQSGQFRILFGAIVDSLLSIFVYFQFRNVCFVCVSECELPCFFKIPCFHLTHIQIIFDSHFLKVIEETVWQWLPS